MTVTFGPTVDELAPRPPAPENGRRRDAAFEYVRVGSYDEAVEALEHYGARAKVLAGGQSLVPMMNLRLVRPGVLIDINGIDAGQPYFELDRLVLPAMTRYCEVLASPTVSAGSPLLAAAVSRVGNVRVRNRGTLGGSLAQGEATAELGAVMLALGSEIIVYGPRGYRTIAAEDFFLGYLTTSLQPEEVITGLCLPLARPRRGWSFHEMSRRSGSSAIVGVAANVELAPDGGEISSARLGLIGVADRPVVGSFEAVSSLEGEVPTLAQLDAVAFAVAAATCPVDDVQASGSYRRRMVRVLARRALNEAVLRAGGRVGTA